MKHRRNLVQSVADAFRGIRQTWRTERNFWWECLIAVALLPGMFAVPLTAAERFGVGVAVVAVLTVELINTAIERAVDTATREEHADARAAKDAAAAAVFIVAMAAFAYACVLAWRLGARWGA